MPSCFARPGRKRFVAASSLPADVVGDLDDLCLQAANDALVAVLRQARRLSRREPIHDLGLQVRRARSLGPSQAPVWSKRRVALDDVLVGTPGRTRPRTSGSLGRARRVFVGGKKISSSATLTEHQRRVFLAVVAEEIPIDVIAERMGSSRGAVYKMVYDARRKLRMPGHSRRWRQGGVRREPARIGCSGAAPTIRAARPASRCWTSTPRSLLQGGDAAEAVPRARSPTSRAVPPAARIPRGLIAVAAARSSHPTSRGKIRADRRQLNGSNIARIRPSERDPGGRHDSVQGG